MLTRDPRDCFGASPLRLAAVLSLLAATACAFLEVNATSDCSSGPSSGHWTVQTTVTFHAPETAPHITKGEECVSRKTREEKNGTSDLPPAIRYEYTFVEGVGYYKLHTTKKVWLEAKQICEEESAHLAIINSKEEENAIKDTIKGRVGSLDFVFIGINDIEDEGEFMTVLGEPFSSVGYANWAEGEPNNAYPEEDCGSMRASGQINDFYCDLKRYFLCEIPL